MIEVLTAALIASTAIAAMVTTWSFCFNLVDRGVDQSEAYNVARQILENIKETGFSYTAEQVTPAVTYYDGSGSLLNSSSGAELKVSTTVVSDKTISGSDPVQPDPAALRTVTITVTSVRTGDTLCQMSTYLVRAGI